MSTGILHDLQKDSEIEMLRSRLRKVEAENLALQAKVAEIENSKSTKKADHTDRYLFSQTLQTLFSLNLQNVYLANVKMLL